MKKHIKVLRFVFVIFYNYAFSQHPAFYQINDENNLPSNEVYRVLQDDFGYIWLGSDAGLCRYDGFDFKTYSNSKQNGKAISFLTIDKKQRVWCKNFFGQIYRVDGDSLKIIKNIKTSNASYPQFALDDDCNLWIYRDSFIIKLNQDGDSLSSYKVSLKLNEEIVSMYYDNGFIYAFSSSVALIKLNPKSSTVVKFPSFSNTISDSRNCMFIKHKNKLLLMVRTSGLQNSYCIYQIHNNHVSEFYEFKKLENNQLIYSIYSDGNNLWGTSSFGAFKIDKVNSVLNLFPNQKISYMLRDREGMYWFSSLTNGLFVVPVIEVMTLNSSNNLVINENNLTAINVSSDKQVMFGSYLGNVFAFDKRQNLVKENYNKSDEYFAAVKKIWHYNNFTIVSRGRFCVIDDRTGRQYFPKISNVRDFEILNDTIYMVLPEFICKAAISDLIKKEQNFIKISTVGGKSVEYNSSDNTLYFVLGNGTFIYHLNGVWEEVKVNNESIAANSMSYSEGLMWISTINSGIYGLKNNKVKYQFNVSNCLSENTTRYVKGFGNYIWFTTDSYLYKINYETSKFEILKLDASHSIKPKDINAIDVNNDTVYLATQKGLVYFPNNLNCKNIIKPNLKLTHVSINNLAVNFSNGLSLMYDHKNLKISFSSVSLKSREKFKYQYRLNGLDSSWIDVAPSTPFVLFSKVPSGKFIFELRSVNENQVYSHVVTLPITVSFPFWNRWWFFALLTVLISGIVTFLFSIRIRFIKKRADLRNRVTASQLTALKSQMNPHFLFNTLNSLQDLILKHDIKNSNFYLNKFSLLMREILDVSGKDEIVLSREIKMLDVYLELEKLRFGDEFTFQLDVHEDLDVDHLKLPPMIIQPFIENSLKHGLLHKKGPKLLSVRFYLEEMTLICEVIDNGVGRKRSGEIKSRNINSHQSFATQATEKRMDLLNSFNNKKYNFKIFDLEVNQTATGTKVIISIPI
jgi:hypothetical protein